MKKNINKTKGFTLIEVVVGLAIFSIITVALVSILTVSFRINYTNKDTYTADTYSKAFFEGLKNESARPNKKTAPFEKTYYKMFKTVDEVTDYAINDFKSMPDSIGTLAENPNTNLSGAMSKVKQYADSTTDDETVGFIVKVRWNNAANQKIYEIETWTWNFDKDESSLINRKTLLAGK